MYVLNSPSLRTNTLVSFWHAVDLSALWPLGVFNNRVRNNRKTSVAEIIYLESSWKKEVSLGGGVRDFAALFLGQ